MHKKRFSRVLMFLRLCSLIVFMAVVPLEKGFTFEYEVNLNDLSKPVFIITSTANENTSTEYKSASNPSKPSSNQLESTYLLGFTPTYNLNSRFEKIKEAFHVRLSKGLDTTDLFLQIKNMASSKDNENWSYAFLYFFEDLCKVYSIGFDDIKADESIKYHAYCYLVSLLSSPLDRWIETVTTINNKYPTIATTKLLLWRYDTCMFYDDNSRKKIAALLNILQEHFSEETELYCFYNNIISGLSFYKNNEFKTAINHLIDALGSYEVYYEKYSKKKRLYEHKDYLKADLLFNIGVCYRWMENYEKAVESFEEGIELVNETEYPRYFIPYFEYAYSLGETGKYWDAVGVYKKIPESVSAINNIVLIYVYKLPSKRNAMEYINKLKGLDEERYNFWLDTYDTVFGKEK